MDVTAELAELFGAYVGDGTMSINKKEEILLLFSASKDEKEWLEHIASLLERASFHRPKVR